MPRNDHNHARNQCQSGLRAARPMSPRYLGPIESYVKQEIEREIAARLAALEALDPSQKRPTPKPNILNSVAFLDL